MTFHKPIVLLFAWAALLGAPLPCPAAAAAGRLMISIRSTAGAPLPCRVQLIDAEGEAQRAEDLPSWNDHFVCPGTARLDLRPGRYELTIERGPEYERHQETLQLEDGDTRDITITLKRIADLRAAGWYSADLHVHRPPDDIELLIRAEDLDFAPVITWWNQRNLWRDNALPADVLRRFDGHRLYHLMAGEDEREGGALLYFGLRRPLDITAVSREIPSPMQFVEAAYREDPDVWIDIEKPFWWDVPTWLASGKMKSIGIANNHMNRSGMLPNEAWGRPRDKLRLPDPLGNAWWTQEIYYHALNTGLRLPPSAGSASGVLPNPVGYNRVYVHLDDAFTHENWWQALADGKCFVTNGPLLVCRANGELPGHVFQTREDAGLAVRLEASLTSRNRVQQLEIVHNGNVVKSIACSPAVNQDLQADLKLSGSGWFLVRAIAENDETFRFGCTGPYYIEDGDGREHINRDSCAFFVKWLDERIERVESNIPSEDDRRAVLRYHEAARRYWQNRLDRATTGGGVDEGMKERGRVGIGERGNEN